MADTTPEQRWTVDKPATALRWRLHVLASPDPRMLARPIDLEPGTWSFGRQPLGQRVLEVRDELASRQHGTLHVGETAGRVKVRDAGSRNGTRVGGRGVTEAELGHGSVLRWGQTVAVLEADSGRAREYAGPSAHVPGLSETARRTRQDLDDAASSGMAVLIVGETGTGKEFAAREIHVRSGRTGPLVVVNVAGLPDSLFDSEFLGHTAGAFTGAAGSRPGRLREAHTGTLVLDELGELPLTVQPKLLRWLEESHIRPVGASKDVTVDVRFVASTNADLDALVAAGRFRRDLLARIRVHEIRLAPLQHRLADLIALANVLVPPPEPHATWSTFLSADSVEAMLTHPWSANLRELRAALVALGQGRAWQAQPVTRIGPQRPDAQALTELLARHNGNIEAIARETGRHRQQIYRWLGYAGIEPRRSRSGRS